MIKLLNVTARAFVFNNLLHKFVAVIFYAIINGRTVILAARGAVM